VRVWGLAATLVALAVLASPGAAQQAPALLVISSERAENSAGQLYLVDPRTGRTQNLSRWRRTAGDADAFPGRGRVRLALTREEIVCCTFNNAFADVWIVDGAGRQLNLTATPNVNESAPSVAPDGTTVAFYRRLPTDSGREDVRLVVQPPGGGARELLKLESRSFEPPAWSPDGRLLLVAENDPDYDAAIKIVGLDGTARKVALPSALDGAWLRTGNLVVAGSTTREGPLDLFVAGPDGRVRRRLTRTRLDERRPRPSPDGSRLAFLRWTSCASCDPRYRLWVGNSEARAAKVVAGRTGRCSGAGCRTIDRAEWSPDGRFLAVASSRLQLHLPIVDRVFLVNLRTRRIRALPFQPTSELTSGPRWLGSQVAYTSQLFGAGRRGLWLVREDGVSVRRLTRGRESQASWSPDGRRLVYVARGGLWTMNASGSDRRPLTMNGGDFWPAWSPDGRRIAFGRGRSVVVLDLRTRRTKVVVRSAASELSWSPDGRTLAFATVNTEEVDKSLVWIVGADGTGRRRVAGGQGPSWSPDGRRMAFERLVLRPGKNNYWVEVWTCDPDGGNAVKLAEVQAAEDAGRTAWSPDGRTIAFHAAEEVYGVPPAGGAVRSLTNNPAYDFDPAWRP
jgi:Tol biopolymer transport system component